MCKPPECRRVADSDVWSRKCDSGWSILYAISKLSFRLVWEAAGVIWSLILVGAESMIGVVMVMRDVVVVVVGVVVVVIVVVNVVEVVVVVMVGVGEVEMVRN